jgi:hypothetical protein
MLVSTDLCLVLSNAFIGVGHYPRCSVLIYGERSQSRGDSAILLKDVKNKPYHT